jgi:Smg protein
MMDHSVFDILIYVFDRYVLEELPASAERETLVRDLESAGFGGATVERALDWLADLAEVRERPNLHGNGALRLYAAQELARLDVQCRGLLASLEAAGILSPSQREIVIDRLLALDTEELDLEQVKWVVLMVLSSPAKSTPTPAWKIWYSMFRIALHIETSVQRSLQSSAARPRFFVLGSRAQECHG